MNKKTIIFLDVTYPEPYQVSTLSEKALGGTESSIVKTALILSEENFVYVAQKCRKTEQKENSNLKFIPMSEMDVLDPDHIIVLRKYPILETLRLKFPKAHLYLWLHTFKGSEYVFKRFGLSKTNTTIICNSKTHRNEINRQLNKGFIGFLFSLFIKKIKVKYCYNPIDNYQPHCEPRNINKLLFLSSPNKGLDQVLESFKFLNKKLPETCLYIANPGYKSTAHSLDKENIINLGSIPHSEIVKHLRSSLCVYYPQNYFSETFGLIYAEANSCGTAVLAHDIGAAKEILDTQNDLIDVRDFSVVVKLIEKWQKKYPSIKYNKKFSKRQVKSQWKKLFDF